jgi:hypothetical protein
VLYTQKFYPKNTNPVIAQPIFLSVTRIIYGDFMLEKPKSALDAGMVKAATKLCADCSSSQQIKCFGIDVVSRGVSKNRKCTRKQQGLPE